MSVGVHTHACLRMLCVGWCAGVFTGTHVRRRCWPVSDNRPNFPGDWSKSQRGGCQDIVLFCSA